MTDICQSTPVPLQDKDGGECECNEILSHPCAEILLKNEDLLEKTSDFFRMLADRTRTRILFALSTDEMCVCELSGLLGMTKSAVSHQLATLREAGFVTCRRMGKSVRYSLADAHVEHILKDGLAHASEPKEVL